MLRCYVFFSVLMGFFAERILGQTERPADIVRRRVEQAGYDQTDAVDLLNYDLSFILKFVYKSQLLGPAVRS